MEINELKGVLTELDQIFARIGVIEIHTVGDKERGLRERLYEARCELAHAINYGREIVKKSPQF